MQLQGRVANLPFLNPDFEILAFFEYLWLFLEIKKCQAKSGFQKDLEIQVLEVLVQNPSTYLAENGCFALVID